MTELQIKVIKPDLIEDFLFFFDNVAFKDNPDWSRCYCYFYHCNCSDEEWLKRTKEENRNASKNLILNDKMSGLLAYIEEKPVGWCNVGLKNNYPKLLLRPNIEASKEKIASIVCFVISSEHRRKGIARQLLQKACILYKENKYDYIEAYPRKGHLSDAQHYHGPISLYDSEGFSIFKRFKDFYVIRRKL